LNTVEISFPLFGENFVINPPRYFTVFGFDIYYYGIIMALGFTLAGIYMYKRCELFGLTRDNILDIVILAVPSGIIGARIYYIVFNSSEYFGAGKWHNIFMMRHGGLAVYGGIIGGALSYMIYGRRKKIPMGKLFDAGSFGLFIGQAVGRWGNFINREAYGGITNLPWRMGLMGPSGFVYVHPTFLYESLWNTIGLILMHIYSKKQKKKYDGKYFLLYVVWYGFGRYLIEAMRTDSLYIAGTDIRVSQLLAAISCIAAAALLARNHIRDLAKTVDPN